jgi:DNA modification methylase
LKNRQPLSSKTVPLANLLLDDNNANKGTKRGRELLAKSLARLGLGRSVVIDRNGRVIAGNKTVEAARKRGLQNIHVVETDGDTLVAVMRRDLDLKKDKKAKELAVADNRVAELDLEWDPEALSKLDVDLGEFWNEAELRKVLGEFAPPLAEAPEPKLEKAAELQRKWKTARGQIWEIGKHRMMCGDCTDRSAVERLLAGQVASLIATDPPYGVSYGKVVSSRANQKAGGWCDITNDELDDDALFALLYGCFSLCKAPVAVIWYGFRRSPVFWKAITETGWAINEQIVWVKNALVFGRADYQWKHEQAFYCKRDGAKGVEDRTQTTVWEVDKPSTSDHPTQKPVELFAIPMRNHTEAGGLCYEPFSGSGSCLCAAELTERVCYAMEIEPKYVAVALERLSEMGLQPKLAHA